LPIFKKIAITSLKEWENYAGPKSSFHWKDGRSAKESARAWLEGKGTRLPKEVQSALEGHQAFGVVQHWYAEPEVKLRFDSFAGEPRNSDLVVHARDSQGPYLITVEAKADEPYGETIAKTMVAAEKRYKKSHRSNGVTRIKQLAVALFGTPDICDPPLKDIRYQLLTACAGTLCEAERYGYTRALMLIHEFVTENTSDDKHFSNAADLNSFVNCLSNGSVIAIRDGGIYGPFFVPGTPLLLAKVELFIGKVKRVLRTSA